MKRNALILAILLMSMAVLTAQITSHYSFSATTETYTTINGTSIPTALGDNVISNPVDIGFPFVYGANTYNQVKVSSNGYVTLGTTPGSSANNALVSNICPVLAPLWDDNYLQGSAQWLLSGTSPNRIFTIQFTSMKWPKNTPTLFNFQVRLHENSTIEYIYGPSVGSPTNASASIGINMLPGGYENFISVTPGNPATSSHTAENFSVNVWPGANTKYVFSPPIQHSNDLATLSLDGPHTPTVGLAYTYTVAIHNNGTATQSNYSVSIISGVTELASVAGPTIAPGVSIEVPISWTPSTEGPTIIEGQVELTGDEDPANDLSLPMEVIVLAEGTTAITIGDGTETARKPVDVSYLNSMFQTIYPASEITLNGTITGISFYNSFVDNRPNMPTKIWLGTTTQNNLSSGWIPAYQMVQVFNGLVTYPRGENIIHISFNPSNVFNYTGGNLVMLVNRPLDTSYYSASNQFLCQTIGSNRSRNAYSDATVFDPNNMGTAGTVSGQFPKTTFYLLPAEPDPAFNVSPESHDFGQVLINQADSQPFQVNNSGGGVLHISSISITGSTSFSLTDLPALPITLSSGQSTSFSVQYLPTTQGLHSGSISITDDLNRLVHTVPLSGTGYDPTIFNLPYTQTFDTVTAPDLPFEWQKIVLSSASVISVTNSPHSSPNCILMNNSTSLQGPYLIAPPITSTIPINTLRIRFWAKAASGFSLNLGVMTNPQDYTSFNGIQNVMLSNQWAEYVVDLRYYAGSGQYLAFRHNQGGNNRSIYIDNVVVEQILLSDMAALQITGETTPNLDSTYNYAISIQNCGLNAQDDYQVKLYKTGNIELASVTGPYLEGNGQATVIIPWTPEIVENTQIYGKVVLDGDQMNSNDQTPNLNISVQESTTTLVVVGSGNQSSNLAPVEMSALCSLYQNIYRQDELEHSGLISMVNFYNVFLSNMPPKPTKIWLGMTLEDDLSEGWIPASQLSLVFDGEVVYPNGVNTISIPLQQPYTLTQGYNLVMMVQRPLDTVTYSSWDNFFCQTDTAPRARVVSSSGPLDPESPPPGNFTAQFPKTGFYITPGGAGSLSGTVFGVENQALVGANVHLINGPLDITDDNGYYAFPNIFARDYTIAISAHGYDDLTQYVSILPDSNVVMDFTLTPTQTVTLTGVITGSNDPTTGLPGAQIVINGYEDYEAVCDAEGSFVIDSVYAGHSYSYTASATGYHDLTGNINVGDTSQDMGEIVLTEISYPPTNVTATITNNHSTVDILWLAPNPESSLRDLIGYRVWRMLQGQEEEESTWVLLTPENVSVQRFTDSTWNSLPQGHYKWAVKSVYTNNVYSVPVISNALETTGILTGIVRNEGMEPLQGAIITAGSFTATSGVDGSYIMHLPGGTYNVICSLDGYYISTQYDIAVTVGQTTTLDFEVMAVGNDDEIQIANTQLYGNYPNPFNPETTISFDLKDPSQVRLDIYNLKGQLIRRLLDENKAAGRHSVVWDGRDAHGNCVSSGIYQTRIIAGSYQCTKRMTLIK